MAHPLTSTYRWKTEYYETFDIAYAIYLQYGSESLPSVHSVHHISALKLDDWLAALQPQPLEVSRYTNTNDKKTEAVVTEIILRFQDAVVGIDIQENKEKLAHGYIVYGQPGAALAEELRVKMLELRAPKTDGETSIELLVKNKRGLETVARNLPKQPLELDLFYAEGFAARHTVLLEKLNKHTKGLVLLHGKPGTGKSTYIRYLTGCLGDDRKFLYIPAQFIEALASPDFLRFFMNYQNAVLVVEDAENVLQKRNGVRTEALANLLNLSDGILSDILNIVVICTFNVEIGQLDPALLRKGRLIFTHEFKLLEPEAAVKLAQHLGKPFAEAPTEPIPLAEVFHTEQEQAEFATRKRIGF